MKQYIVSYGNEQEEVFYNLAKAKAFMKENHGSTGVIYKFWSNGDFECIGEIKLTGSNKTFVANTKQKLYNY